MISSPTTPQHMLPPTMNASPPNIRFSESPASSARDVADAGRQRVVVGHDAMLARTGKGEERVAESFGSLHAADPQPRVRMLDPGRPLVATE
jgi:hypothetical protein